MTTRHTSLFVLMVVFLIAAVPAMAAPCESLSTLKLTNTTITSAQSVAAGPAAGGRGGAATPLPAYCRVQATIKPTSDSEIKVEVWMPATGWNGKFQGVGNGGWSGRLEPVLSRLLCNGVTPQQAQIPAMKAAARALQWDIPKSSSTLDIEPCMK